MSKLYISVLAVALVAGSATAQRADIAPALKKTRSVQMRNTSTPIQYSADRAEIWSDDFSDPNTWVLGVAPGTDTELWQIGTDAPAGPVYGIEAIESTSADNGFALFDSDFWCGGNQNAYIRMATSVNLSASVGVVLQFEQYYRRFQGNTYVEVSVDGGNAWETIEVNTAVGVNGYSPNPELVRLNITDLVAGQPNVLIQFRYEGGCDYAWMVDDVSIIDQPASDLVINYSFLVTTAPGYQYCRIPANELDAILEVGAEVFSFGYEDQTNVTLTMELRDESNGLAAELNFPIGTMMDGDTVFVDELVDISTLAAGIYTATFNVTSDQNVDEDTPDNNTYLRAFQVNNGLFSLDGIGIHPPGYLDLGALGSGSYVDDQVLQMFTYYQVANETTVYGLEVQISAGSDAGSFLFAAVYDSTTVLGDDFVNQQNNTIYATPDAYTLTAADVASGTVFIPFDTEVTLPAGGYYASITAYQDGDNDLFVLDDLTVDDLVGGGSLIYLPSDETVYGNGNAFAIRLVIDGTISVDEENALEGVSMYPNPTNGILRINTTTSEKFLVEVMNVLGEQVMTTSFAGNTVLDLGAYADGVYTVRVSNGTKTTVQRITLN